jgi:hypothetical protein
MPVLSHVEVRKKGAALRAVQLPLTAFRQAHDDREV